MTNPNGTPFPDEAWQRWYANKSSSELEQEREERELEEKAWQEE